MARRTTRFSKAVGRNSKTKSPPSKTKRKTRFSDDWSQRSDSPLSGASASASFASSQGSSPLSSTVYANNTAASSNIQTDVLVDGIRVRYLVKLGLDGIVYAPLVNASATVTSRGEESKDKLSCMDTLTTILSLSHSHRWSSVLEEGSKPWLSKEGHGFFIRCQLFNVPMANNIDAAKSRLEMRYGKSEARDRSLVVTKNRLLGEDEEQEVLMFFQFPPKPGTTDQILCQNDELQDPDIEEDDQSTVSALPTKKTSDISDENLGTQKNSHFSHILHLPIQDTKEPIKLAAKAKKKKPMDMSDVRDAVNDADASNGDYGASDGSDDGSDGDGSGGEDSSMDMSGNNGELLLSCSRWLTFSIISNSMLRTVSQTHQHPRADSSFLYLLQVMSVGKSEPS